MIDKAEILELVSKIVLEAFQEGQHDGLGLPESAKKHKIKCWQLREELERKLNNGHIFHHPV